jgi:large subunit ribosomal protein L10
MALNLDSKKAIVAEVATVASSALSVVAADYRGLSVGEMNDLRVKARENGVYLRVVRNTLARRAVEGTEFECMKDVLLGPLVLGFSQEEPGAAARLFRDFMKTCDRLEVKALGMGGKAMPAEQLQAMAKLPTRDEALATLLNVMKAPVTKFVRTLAEPYAQTVRVFAAVRDSKK